MPETSRDVLRGWLLAAVRDLGGTADRRAVHAKIREIGAGAFTPEDERPRAGRPADEAAWQNNVDYLYDNLKREGVFESSQRGDPWRLTVAGALQARLGPRSMKNGSMARGTRNDAVLYGWTALYQELASKLVDYREPDRQRELIALLTSLRAKGLTITSIEDKDEAGRRFLLEEIDPFTFFGVFNRGTTNDNRIRILEELKAHFQLSSAVPRDFEGVPVIHNQGSWFFGYRADRDPSDVARLWRVFTLALGPRPLEDPDFALAFDDAMNVKNTNVNLTMGLFWIRPTTFLSLDSAMRARFDIALPSQGISFAYYRDAMSQIKERHSEPFYELSYDTWTRRGRNAAPARPPQEARADVEYWLVGAYWDGADPHDQTERFLAEGVWQNGWEDRFLDQVREMKPGDRIAIKATTTQQSGLPFDNRGKTVSRLLIKARGTVVRNRGDGRTVEIEWEPRGAPRDWYFYTNRPTVWHLRKDDEFAQTLIRYTFFDEPQDYGFYTERWWGKGPGSVPPGPEVDPAPPYSIADALAEGVFLSEEEVGTAIARLETKKALLLQGAPGVGKTFLARKLAYALMDARDDERVTIVQFHPSFSYEDFVRGYRPGGEAGKFELKDGPFLRFCNRASRDLDRRYVLIVDEINRAHLSQVFGEIFMLLEADKRGPKHAITPLYQRSETETIHVPENVYVIGTMNVVDRSLALVDLALRRRFAFLTLEPQFARPAFRAWLLERKMPEALVQRIVQRMEALNAKIESDTHLGSSFRIGHSFFCPRGDDFSRLDDAWFRTIVDTEIAPLLEEYWHDAPEKVKGAAGDLRS